MTNNVELCLCRFFVPLIHKPQYRQQVREQLASESGAALMKRRGIEVESVFGHLKEDRRFRRFLLRGLEKVKTEWGLLSIAHNLLKQTALQG